MQGAGADGRAAPVSIGSRQAQGTRARLGQAAGTGNNTTVAARSCLIEDQRSIVGDIALQAGRIALQGTCRDGGATRVGVRTSQCQRAGTQLDQRAIAGDHARVTGIGPLIERQGGIVDDVALQAGRIALQGARADRGATAIRIGTGQGESSGAELDQRARARHHTRITAVGDLIESQRGVIEDVALQAGDIALQGAGTDSRAAGIGIGTGKRECARPRLGQATCAGNHTRIGSRRSLVEDQRSVIGDIALQARGVALKGTCADGGTAAVRIGTAERERARPRLGQRAGA